MSLQIPLTLRQENAPPVFVGREAERVRLGEILEGGPLAIVCGFSGMGKSALFAQVMEERFATERERCVVVDATGGPLPAALRALTRVTGTDLDWQKLSATAAAEALIELGDAHQIWLVLENVATTDDAGLHAAMTLAGRFARAMKLVVLSREDPRVPALAPYSLVLGPMPDADLASMLEHHREDLDQDEAESLVQQAKGSPWRLLQLTVGEPAGDVGPEHSLQQLAPVAQGLLRTLALMPGALPEPVLGRALRMPGAEAISTLARRGFLERSAGGLRLHDAARPFVESTWQERERSLRTEKLLKALAEDDDPALALAAVALALRAGNPKVARAHLDQSGPRLLDAGHGQELKRLLAECADPDLRAWAEAHLDETGLEWTIECQRHCVVLQDGSRIDLSRSKVLFELLAAICRAGGSASKELLLEKVWGIDDYHPLKHDNRLKVAVRKLRRLLETPLGEEPVEAVEDGYRLRGRPTLIE